MPFWTMRRCQRGATVSPCGFWKVAVLLIALAALAGCGSSPQKRLYAVGLGTPDVVTFHVSNTGALTSTATLGTGSVPTAIIVAPNRRFAFVADSAVGSDTGGISQYTMSSSSGVLAGNTTDANGNPGSIPVPPVLAGTNPVALAVDSKGKFLFVANQGSNNISVFTINQSTGIITPIAGSPFSTAVGPTGLAVSGNHLFVANQGAGVVSAYSFDSTSGALSAVSGSPFTAGLTPTALDVDPAGQFLYVADQVGHAVLGFSVKDGQLTPLTGSPFATGSAPVSVRVHRSGKFLYVANSGDNNVSGFVIDSAGALSAVSGSPFTVGTTPSFLSTDSKGRLLFVANQGSGNISVFQINNVTGGLVGAPGSPFFVAVGDPSGLASIN